MPKKQEIWIKYVSHFAAWQENLCPSGFARKAGDLTGSLSKQTHFVKKCTYMFWKCSAVAKWYYILLMNTMWFSKPLFIIIVTLTSLHSCTNYSASSKYLCCIFEIRFTMKILVKRITATRKTFLVWELLESSLKAWTFAQKITCRHLNYSTEKPAFQGPVKTTSAHTHRISYKSDASNFSRHVVSSFYFSSACKITPIRANLNSMFLAFCRAVSEVNKWQGSSGNECH